MTPALRTSNPRAGVLALLRSPQHRVPHFLSPSMASRSDPHSEGARLRLPVGQTLRQTFGASAMALACFR